MTAKELQEYKEYLEQQQRIEEERKKQKIAKRVSLGYFETLKDLQNILDSFTEECPVLTKNKSFVEVIYECDRKRGGRLIFD